MAKKYIEREANCVDCIHAEVCLQQYGLQVKRWVLTDGCKRYKSTADVIGVVHGEWTKRHFWDGGVGYMCSACGLISDLDTPFCSMCGARMDGKDGKI